MTSRIDLSRLARPVIPGLVLDIDAIHQQMLAWLDAEYGWRLTRDASDPAWRLTRLWAAREALVRRATADAAEQVSLAYATGDVLDVVGATYYRRVRLDAESDDAYRSRLAAAPELYAVGLSGPWYEARARDVAGVRDARFVRTAPGFGVVYILATDTLVDDNGDPLYPRGVPDAALLSAVDGALTAPETRQQTDDITTVACTRDRYDVRVTLTLRAEPDSATVLADARAALDRLAEATAVLGGFVTTTIIAGAAINVAAVSRADVRLETVADDGSTAPVDALPVRDSVAPLARHIEVRVA